MSTDFWTTRRDSKRVQAALAVKCGLCGAKPGNDCRSIGDARKPLAGGMIVHQQRVPEKVLMGVGQ